MDKNAIKKFAVWARTELRDRVTKKIDEYAISADADPNADAVRGKLLTKDEKEQRAKLIAKFKEKGMDQVVEEGAYTWFNRFSALRFMEVNNYLPTRVRVFTDAEGTFHPQILTEAIHLELKGLDMDKVYALKEADDKDALFKYLIITQCNAFSDVLPGMFQKIADYTELLFPDNLLREGSVIEKMISDIPEDNWDVTVGGQIEILGWLYQYYISEKHDQVINIESKEAVTKENLPAATALFTTDWVVRYIIDNSVGRYWIERNPSSKLKDELEYFVTPKDGVIPTVNEQITPDQLTVLDPSMGSAHFGVYAFEVLEKIYTEYGYTEREAASSIVQNNLYGLDIDDRSAQIAYFAIMMKAMQYDKRFLKRGIQPHFYSIQESNGIDSYTVDYFTKGNVSLKKDISSIISDFKDAKEYGSIIQVAPVDFTALYARFDEIKSGEDINLYSQIVIDQLLPIVQVAEVMSRKYAVVATNPPYLNKFDSKLNDYIVSNYKEYSGDLFSVFIYRNFNYCKKNGYSGFMTPFVWMFIKTYEKLRYYILQEKSISTLIQLEYSAFEEATVPICTFVLKNGHESCNGLYLRLSEFKGGMNVQNAKVLEALNNPECAYFYEKNQRNFMEIAGEPIAYWLSEIWFKVFDTSPKLADTAKPRVGQNTGDNERFLRLWHEIKFSKIGFGVSHERIFDNPYKWIPYSKGGAFRRWYGNYYYVINWENDGKEIKDYAVVRNKGKHWSRYIQNLNYMCCEGVTWSDISSSKFACRYLPEGFICDVKGSSAYPERDIILPYLAFLNSSITDEGLKVLAPTISFQTGDISRLPFALKKEHYGLIAPLAEEAVQISKADWDSFETSWDFIRHPLIRNTTSIGEAYQEWEQECNSRFNRVKEIEESLNRMMIEIYGLEKEVSPKVDDYYITVRKADFERDIRSFISYAVGCMTGRFSLDEDGLVFAGGNWDVSRYKSFCADKDGILPICDDEYFDDDITGQFVKFVETVYGKTTLEENLKFIADALGGNGSPRETIRNYFLNDFYTDHCSTYSVTGSGKRPIYWLFDSGKKNGFKCLIYMHRYQPDTIARIRTDYVHEQQARYRTAIAGLARQIVDAPTSERVRLNKQLTKLKDQAEEVRVYEEKIHHLADQMISIDLDDGVKHNYEIFQDVLAKIK